jgi:hypothetical protein
MVDTWGTNQEGAATSSLLVGLSIIIIDNKYKLNIDQDFQIELKQFLF